ncbi:MAG: helix-turn-helix domain-containing protein [Arenibacterium sp.]
MSEQYNFDRKKGFVALPVELFDLDLTPGAFRTLTELCRMANSEGYCWPSLEQLSDRLGRSRSAISGYIKELRTAELVTTEEQKTATGYNYRLKYQVTFWATWRASLSPRPVQRVERGVHLGERLLESKKQSHENQSESGSDDLLDRLLTKWQSCFAGAPYPSVRREPSAEICKETYRQLSAVQEDTASRTSIRSQTQALWKALGIDASAAAVNAQVERLRTGDLTERELRDMLKAMRKSWPVHWRRCPSEEVFDKLIRSTGIISVRKKRAVLRGYYNRWLKAENTLRKPQASCSVAA